MAISKKLKIVNNKMQLKTVEYNNKFEKHRLGKGYKKIDYDNLSDEQLKHYIKQKISYIKKQFKTIRDLFELNVFDYFITFFTINEKDYERFVNNLKKNDKDNKYISLKCWSLEGEEHYHLAIKTSLDQDQLEKKCRKLKDAKVMKITNQDGLYKYFIKNLKDTVSLLEQDSKNIDYKHKQLEILKSKNIVVSSRNIVKPTILTEERRIQEELVASQYIDEIEYHNLYGTKIRVEKYKKISE